MRRLLFLLAASSLALSMGCGAPEIVRRAEIQEAMIFDSVTGELRQWIQDLPEPTPQHAEIKARVLTIIEKRRGEYRALHEQIRLYLETDALAAALLEAEPTFLAYLEWLMEELRDE